jgi:hypothetical protein
MPIRRQSVKVLRFWYRLSGLPEVQKLSHPAFRWLFGVVMQWTGYNNGVIEFTQRRHAAQYRLEHPAVFEKASREVLATGLVEIIRAGGRNLPALYALTNVPRQASVATSHVVTSSKILATSPVAMDEKIATSRVANCYVSRSKENGPYKESRARLNRKVISKPQRAVSVESQSVTAANSDAGQGGDMETQTLVSIPPLASRH